MLSEGRGSTMRLPDTDDNTNVQCMCTLPVTLPHTFCWCTLLPQGRDGDVSSGDDQEEGHEEEAGPAKVSMGSLNMSRVREIKGVVTG